MVHAKHRTRSIARRAFTLAELMIVMIIIGLVLAIIVPALGKVRQVAKKVQTTALMEDLLSAMGTFTTDNRRQPGYFTPADMGSPDNLNWGMSTWENVMLDLSGAEAIVDQTGPETVEVGPTNDDAILVRPDLIGVGSGAYFNPDGKYLVPQYRDLGQQMSSPARGHTGEEGEPQLPDLVDAFGNPILVWVEDDLTLEAISHEQENFAGISTDDGRKRFYYASNKAFLEATSLGRGGKNQADLTTGSMLCYRVAGRSLVDSLTGFLGSPNAPDEHFDMPTASRGKLVIHSAGIDGVYFGLRDDGAKQFDNGYIDYSFGFLDSSGNRWVGDDGKPESFDVTDRFDDLYVSGGT